MPHVTPEIATERADYYRRIGEQGLTPLWEVLSSLVTREPVSPVLPACWSYSDIRSAVLEAGRLITAEESERRVLILENPGLRGKSCITRTLYAGLQLLLPGEVARAHRHTQSALRFVMEGAGAFTAVNGERTTMHPGDFVITPSWTWHDHGNPSDAPMIWLDGLDIPLISSLDASFSESGNARQQQISRPEGDALARYGQGLLPVDWQPSRASSPIFNYPYARTREALHTMSRSEDADPHHGYKLRYINPASGGYAMPTIAAFIQLLESGFATAPYRSSDATVLVIVEGQGRTQIGDQVYDWSPRDILVVPPWTWVHHNISAQSVIFSFSDRAVQQKLDLWREDRSAH